MNFLPNVKSSATVTRDGIVCHDEEEKEGGFKINNNVMTVTVRRDIVAQSSGNERKRKTSSSEIDFKNIRPCSLEELPPPFKLKRRIRVKPKSERPLKKHSKGSAISEHIASLKRKQLYCTSRNEAVDESLSTHRQSQDTNSHQVVPSSPSSSVTLIEDPVLQSFDELFSKPVIKPMLDNVEPITSLKPLRLQFNQEETFSHYNNNMPHTVPPAAALCNTYDPAGPGSEFLTHTSAPSGIFPLPVLSSPPSPPPPFNPAAFGLKNFYPREE